VLTVTDQAGQVVRRVTGPTGKGLHRVAWDLRYPAVDPTQLEERPRESWEYAPQGPLVVPGTFTVALAKKVDGVLTPLGSPKTFVVESLTLATLPRRTRPRCSRIRRRRASCSGHDGTAAAGEEALKGLSYMRKALLDTPRADAKLMEQARAIETGIRGAMRELVGDMTVARRSEARLPSLMERVSAQTGSTGPSRRPSCATTRSRPTDSAPCSSGCAAHRPDLRALGAAMESAGAPWTPGRGLPVWKK